MRSRNEVDRGALTNKTRASTVSITQLKLAELARTLVEGIKRRTFRVEELFAGVNPQLKDPLNTSTTRTDAGHRATRALL